MAIAVLDEKADYVRWHLDELLEKYRIRGSELARAVGRSGNSIYSMSGRKDMPRLTGVELADILRGLNQLADPNLLDRPITIDDLITWDSQSIAQLSPDDLKSIKLR